MADEPNGVRLLADHVRYLDIGETDDIDDDQLRDWLRQAASIPGEDTF